MNSVPRLGIDLGELADEPLGLYLAAELANVACGGHAGDEGSMRRACELAREHWIELGAHPSYPDREGFGRVSVEMTPDALRECVRAQCSALAGIAVRAGMTIGHMKPHGALYHSAARDPEVALAVLEGALDALGGMAVIGPTTGALRTCAESLGMTYWREGFADRGYTEDGGLIARGFPGATIEDPVAAAEQCERLVGDGGFDVVCVHGDGANSVEVAKAVRSTLERLRGV